MSAASFYLGLLGLVAFVFLSGFTAVRLRSRLLPEWDGSLGRLGDIIVWLALVIGISELLGIAGLLEVWSLLLVSALLALFAWLRLMPTGHFAERTSTGASDVGASTGIRSPVPAPPIPGWGKLLALAATTMVMATWASFTSYSLDYGITNFDSIWYHMPFAAEMAQPGPLTAFRRPETAVHN